MPEIKLVPLTQLDTVNNSIKPSRLTIPNWYKQSPQKMRGCPNHLTAEGVSTATYKQCAPFLDGMTLGYMAVLTSDVEVSVEENGFPFINHRDLGRSVVSLHSEEQWEGMEYPLFHYPVVFKWDQSLVIKTPKNYSLLFTHPMNRLDLPFTTITGVVDTDSYEIATHFPFWLKQGFTGIIKAGTPICQIVPIQREKWTSSLQEFDPIKNAISHDNFRSNIVKTYKSLFWKKKQYD